MFHKMEDKDWEAVLDVHLRGSYNVCRAAINHFREQNEGSFVLFTVSHEASHHSASSGDSLNTWLGRFSTPMFAHHAGFGSWRFVHMQHHRFTNDEEGRDPDAYTNRGPAWLAPLRWLTVDLWYIVFYVPRLRSRPRAEHIELAITLARLPLQWPLVTWALKVRDNA